MEPTLDVGQRVLVNRFLYHFTDPSPGDIVVFHPPKGADNVDPWRLVTNSVTWPTSVAGALRNLRRAGTRACSCRRFSKLSRTSRWDRPTLRRSRWFQPGGFVPSLHFARSRFRMVDGL